MFAVISLAALLLYGYGICTLLLTRQEFPLLGAAGCGCLLFALTALGALRRGSRLLFGIHLLASAASAVLLIILLTI